MTTLPHSRVYTIVFSCQHLHPFSPCVPWLCPVLQDQFEYSCEPVKPRIKGDRSAQDCSCKPCYHVSQHTFQATEHTSALYTMEDCCLLSKELSLYQKHLTWTWHTDQHAEWVTHSVTVGEGSVVNPMCSVIYNERVPPPPTYRINALSLNLHVRPVLLLFIRRRSNVGANFFPSKIFPHVWPYSASVFLCWHVQWHRCIANSNVTP